MKRSASRAVLGGVYAIATSGGFGYVQYVFDDPLMGEAIRALRVPLSEVINLDVAQIPDEEQFVTFFPLSAALRQGIVKPVGERPIPSRFASPLVFREPARMEQNGTVTSWWIGDERRPRSTDTLTPSERALPIRAIWNDTLLAERIASGWVHSDYV